MQAPQRILVVDDQESMRLLLCSALRALGYAEVLTAVNGAEALKIARGRIIDLVLLDVEMPVMNGFDTLKAMREDVDLSALRIIMVTGRADSNFVRAIAPLRPSGYLVKPVTAVAIKAAIDRAFGQAAPPGGDAKSA